MLSHKIQHEEFDPPETLKDAIRCFWHDSRQSEEQLSSFEVVPDGYAEIIFHFGNLYTMSQNGDLQSMPSPFMIGLLNQPVRFYTKNRLEIIAIRCYPWTVFDLLGIPSDKSGVRLFEHPLAKLQSALEEAINADNTNEAIAKLREYFVEASSQIAIDSILSKAGMAMKNANGSIPVSNVAEAAHSTVRTLERKFKQSSGHTVKDVSGLMRFEQARNHLWLYPDSNLAGLAHELGYTDQSHLSKEFKRYSGNTPAAFARNAKKLAVIIKQH